MTGKALYDKHCTALKQTERWGYKNSEYVRLWPTVTPPAWQFVGHDMHRYYNALAKLLTSRKRAPVAE